MSTSSITRRAGGWAMACLLAGTLGLAHAQDAAAPAPGAQPAAATGGIRSANIFEIAPDADKDPNYAAQSNAERKQVPFVQYPGSRLTNAGEAWRQVRNHWLIPYGGSLLLIVLLAIAIFYKTKGTMGGHLPDTGRKIERFTPFERAAHWANAGAFIALAISGIVMAFGKFFLLPVIGSTLFGWLTYALKNVHNFVGPLFAVSLLIIVVTFIKDNIANKADFVWLSKAGGMLGGHEVPSHRFNAGEKGLFWWGVTIPGIVVVGSGLFLDKLIPGALYLRGDMQIAHMLHLLCAVWMMALIMGHIYMGTLGVKGAYGAMKTGYVDEAWAKEHHELWYDDVKAGKIPAQRSNTDPAAPLQAAAKA